MNLFSQIDQALSEISHGWTSEQKAHTMAGAVIALRPEVTIEIGVWAGKGMISLALAHKHIGYGMIYGIDPYSKQASVDGQVNPEDKKWWGNVDHEEMYQFAQANISKYSVGNVCRLNRQTSDSFVPLPKVGILRIDGNHGETAARDIERFCPNVIQGGFLFLDDVGWAGGSISRAMDKINSKGAWRELYALDDGKVYQRVK